MSSYKYIKSKYILKIIFNNLTLKKGFQIVHYNKHIQKDLKLSLKDFKNYSEIELELIPKKPNRLKEFFINPKPDDSKYFHIFFNNDKNETKRFYLKQNENITKIKIIIDYKSNIFFKFIQ